MSGMRGTNIAFQSTLSMRRATRQHQDSHHTSTFQSTLSMRRANQSDLR